MEIRMITKAEADGIIATREPRGLFYLDAGKSFVGSAEHGCFRSQTAGRSRAPTL